MKEIFNNLYFTLFGIVLCKNDTGQRLNITRFLTRQSKFGGRSTVEGPLRTHQLNKRFGNRGILMLPSMLMTNVFDYVEVLVSDFAITVIKILHLSKYAIVDST